jgi:putative flippase GtrA
MVAFVVDKYMGAIYGFAVHAKEKAGSYIAYLVAVVFIYLAQCILTFIATNEPLMWN